MQPSLSVARYRFTFRMQGHLRLPQFAGSLLRGQFGAALRTLACMTGADTCGDCPLRGTCPYPLIFETPAPPEHAMQRFSHVPNPYVIEPPEFGGRVIPGGQVLQFSVVLIGGALANLPLVRLALQSALETGLGKDRVRGALEQVEWQVADRASAETAYATVWRQGDQGIAPHDVLLQLNGAPDAGLDRLHIRIHTPMRLQQQGRPLHQNEFTPRKFVADLLRRTTLLAEFHSGRRDFVKEAPALVHLAEGLTHHPNLRWQDWSRYSSRQGKGMTLGGVMGDWILQGELAPLYPWLWLGQWLHVGKNATMGMGAYSLSH